jgi:hypothetical protein
MKKIFSIPNFWGWGWGGVKLVLCTVFHSKKNNKQMLKIALIIAVNDNIMVKRGGGNVRMVLKFAHPITGNHKTKFCWL